MPNHHKPTVFTAAANEEEIVPPSVYPSLWRRSRLNTLYYDLFKRTDGVYQICGFNLSLMSIIETGRRYVVVDPLVTPRTATAGMGLVYEHLIQHRHALDLQEASHG